MSESPVQVAATSSGGCVVRLTGRCTMQHSPAVEQLVVKTLEHDASTQVAVDLASCTFLDSTFLGSLFGLFQRYGGNRNGRSARLSLHASPAAIKSLFGPLKLDRYLRADPSPAPSPQGDWMPLEADHHDPREMSRHVMTCHRRLAEVDTPARAVFTRIADAMEQELSKC